MLYVANAFSLAMVNEAALLHRRVLNDEQAKALIKDRPYTSAVGHKDTAQMMSALLEHEVLLNRINLQLKERDQILVFQVTSGRLPEGATTLPVDFKYRWELISLISSVATAELLHFGADQVSLEVAKELYELWS